MWAPILGKACDDNEDYNKKKGGHAELLKLTFWFGFIFLEIFGEKNSIFLTKLEQT